MLKRILTLIAVACLALSSEAVPAKRVKRTVTQPDGSKLTLVLSGDESFHVWRTLDGVPVVRRQDGTFTYATMRGRMVLPSLLAAHEANVRSEAEVQFIENHAALLSRNISQLRMQKTASRMDRRAHRLQKSRRLQAEATASTKRKGLVILVNFKDVKMQDAHTRQVFDDMMNQENYSGNGNMGSVHDYFLAQSYGKFDISFDVVGPVTLPQNISYYGGNDRYGDDRRPGQMVREACKLIMDDVDFSAYDWDGDGEADQVFVICAGYSEAEGASAKYIWPHEWSLSDAGLSPLDANGIKVDTYGVSTELGEEGNTRLNGIGTACHEFSHCLGLPDMYDTDYSGAFGMDAWSLMDQGSYNGDGYAPVGYTAYERWASGWLVPQELSTPCRISEMPSIAQQPVAYVVYNDGNRNEYFLIENRQQDGWLATDESRGLMVTHVDYDEKAWYNNAVNDYKNHQRCTIVPADNISTSYTLDGDLYPYSGNNELTDESAPSARTFNANTDGSKLLGKPLTDMAISSNGLASFNFMGGVPSAIHDAGVQTMGWEAGTAVEVYDVAGHLLRKSAFSQWSLGLPHGTYLLRSGSQTQCVLH